MRRGAPFLKITVVTPSLNQGRYIESTISSVLNQNYPALEYLIVDGGSTDGTIEILRSFGNRITWTSSPDRGQSDAINKGLRQSTGDILCYLNSDDMLAPKALTRVNEFFLSNPDRSWVTGYCRRIDSDEKESSEIISAYKHFLLRRFRPWTFFVTNYISQMSTFWTRRAYDATGSFSEQRTLTMDYDYWLRLLCLGNPGVIRATLAMNRIHQETKSVTMYRRQLDEAFLLSSQYIRSPLLRCVSKCHYLIVRMIYSMLFRPKESTEKYPASGSDTR